MDYGNSVIKTSDRGYAIVGATQSFGQGLSDVYVMKLDGAGNLQWTRTIGGTGNDWGVSIIQTSDGGYAIAGTTDLQGDLDVYVVKLDGGGNLQWTKIIGWPGADFGSSIIQTSDGGYAIVGRIEIGLNDWDVYVIKLDGAGNLQWTRTINVDTFDNGHSIIQTRDGGYAVVGECFPWWKNDMDIYVVKLDGAGNLQWTKTIGGTGDDHGYSIIQTSDGGYAITGATSSFGQGGYDVYVVKLDDAGNLQWTRTIGGPNHDYGFSIIQTQDGGYVIAGATSSFGQGGYDVYVIKLDVTGNLEWTRTIGGPDNEWSYSVVSTPEGGFAITGSTQSFGHGLYDVYLMKLDVSGNVDVGTCGSVVTNLGTMSAGGVITGSAGSAFSGATISSGGTTSGGGSVYVCSSFCVLSVSIVYDSVRGVLTASVSGGMPPYTYLWSDGSTSQSISVTASGTYWVVVTDANGCTASDTLQVTLPTSVVVPVDGESSCRAMFLERVVFVRCGRGYVLASLHTLEGKMVGRCASEQGVCEIEMGSFLPSGTYILRVEQGGVVKLFRLHVVEGVDVR